MGRPTRFVPQDSSRRKVWVYVGLAAFVAADILLIAFALGSQGAAQSDYSAPKPALLVPVETSAPQLVEPVETPVPTPAPAALPLATTRVLAAIDGATAWRATTGACPDTNASIELTTDGGATWKSTDATSSTQVTAVQQLIATNDTTASAIGLAQADCSPQFVKTFVAGDNYSSYPEQLESTWYVNPANRAVVHSPIGDVPAPCESAIALSPRGDTVAAVLCATGEIATTTDAGASWSPLVAAPGVVAVAAAAEGFVAAGIGDAACAGIQLFTLNDAAILTAASCVALPNHATDSPAERAVALNGNVTVSQTGPVVWLWAGDALTVSEDGGVTWR